MGLLPSRNPLHEAHGPASADQHHEHLPPYVVLAPTHSAKKADEWRFVLKTQNVLADVVRLGDGRFALAVPRVHGELAEATLRVYEAENRPAAPRLRDKPLYRGSMWAAAVAAAMIAFFLFTGPVAAPLKARYFATGTADAAQLLHGAPWQAVTALSLHADFAHVAGNAVSGVVFLAAVHQRLGPGLGTFTVVAAGALGNVLNAVHHHVTGHRSLGASTAVLAAVGVLMAVQLVRNQRVATEKKGFVRTAGPILGGLALLGTIGAHPGSDLWAHLYGFVAGAVVGLVPALVLRKREEPLPEAVQAAFGFAVALLFIGAWTLALRVRLG